MAGRKKPGPDWGGGGEWLNAYAGMATLLLAFFILMFSVSSIDATKFNMLVTAFADGKPVSSSKIVVGGIPEVAEHEDPAYDESMVFTEEQQMTKEDALEQIYRTIRQHIEDNGLHDTVMVSKEKNYVFIRFAGDTLFEPNSAVLKPEDREILQFVGYAVKSIEDYAGMIIINDHATAIPEADGYPAGDPALSALRANAVLAFLSGQIGVEPSKMLAIGWGKSKPVVSKGGETELMKNRRIEILINSENLLSEQLDNIYVKLVQ